MGSGANSGFDFTKELKNMLGKKRIDSEELWEKRRGLGSTVDLILYRNWTNCEEKR